MQDPEMPTKMDGALIIDVVERKLDRVCDQMALLHTKIVDLQSRLTDAKTRGRWSHVDSLGMRLGVLEGVYNMYHEYASRTAVELSRLHQVQLHEKEDHL